MNLLQVKDGYAWHNKKYQHEQSIVDRFVYSIAEMVAKKRKIGLWSEPAIALWDFRRANRE